MLNTLSIDLQNFYQKMQKCTACKLGMDPQNRCCPGHWRLHGWGKERDVVFVGMNPSSGRDNLASPDLIPWGYPTINGVEFNDTYLHYALRTLGWCQCDEFGCQHKWYETNLVKCYTEGQKLDWSSQKKPLIEACMKNNLIEELKLIKPKVVVLMGGTVNKAFKMAIGEIKTADKVYPFYESNYGESMADIGVNAVFGGIYHPKYFIDARQSIDGRKMTSIPQKERVQIYKEQISKIFKRAGVPFSG